MADEGKTDQEQSRFIASAAWAALMGVYARPLDAIIQRDESLSGVVGQHRLPDEPVPLEGGVRLGRHEQEFVALIELLNLGQP